MWKVVLAAEMDEGKVEGSERSTAHPSCLLLSPVSLNSQDFLDLWRVLTVILDN